MRLVCKSSVNKDELAYKSTLGFDGLELQLFSWSDDVDLDYIDGLGLNLVNIHTPLGVYGATLLENLLINSELKNLEVFLNKLKYTNGLNFVFHSEKSLNNNELIKVANTLDRLHNDYGIEFLIENSSLIKTMGKGIGINRFYKPKDIPNVVENIRNLCDGDKSSMVHSLLDITHAVSSIRIANELMYGQEYCLEDYFKEFGSTMKTCHLANCKGYGVGKPYHGVGFQGDEDVLIYYLGLIEKYCTHLDYLVIEMVEGNYQICENMLHCKSIIDTNTNIRYY